MSKKTSPLLLRLGISNLWKQNLNFNAIYPLVLKFQPLINYFLILNGLSLIKLKYRMNVIFLYVFCQKTISRILKKHIILSYSQDQNFYTIFRVFGIGLNQLKWFFHKNYYSKFNVKKILLQWNFQFKKIAKRKVYLNFLFFLFSFISFIKSKNAAVFFHFLFRHFYQNKLQLKNEDFTIGFKKKSYLKKKIVSISSKVETNTIYIKKKFIGLRIRNKNLIQQLISIKKCYRYKWNLPKVRRKKKKSNLLHKIQTPVISNDQFKKIVSLCFDPIYKLNYKKNNKQKLKTNKNRFIKSIRFKRVMSLSFAPVPVSISKVYKKKKSKKIILRSFFSQGRKKQKTIMKTKCKQHRQTFFYFIVLSRKLHFIRNKSIQKVECNFISKPLLLRKFNIRFLKLTKINSLLKSKFLSLRLESIIFSYGIKNVQIKLLNCLTLYFPFIAPFFSKSFFKKKNKKQNYISIIVCFLFFNTSILNNFISNIVKQTRLKQHIKNLLFFFKHIKYIFNLQLIALSGFKFQIKGKLGGKLRKSKFKYKLGKINTSSFSLNISYSSLPVYTRYGIFGLKTWLAKINEFNISKNT